MFLQRVRKGARRAPQLTTVQWEAASALTSRSAATLALVSHRGFSSNTAHSKNPCCSFVVRPSRLLQSSVFKSDGFRPINRTVKLPRFPMFFLSIVKKIQFLVSGLFLSIDSQIK